MGKTKYIKDIENLFKKSLVVSASSINRVVRKDKNNQYAKQLIRNLILRGKIKRLSKGHYTSHDDPSLFVFCFRPSYIGLQAAMSFHNLWEQETIPLIITTRKVRQGIRKVIDMNVYVRRIDKKYFFGFDYYLEGDFYLPYSNLEKTFIDMIYFKEHLSNESINNILNKINRKRLNSYLKVYPRRIRGIVLRYLS